LDSPKEIGLPYLAAITSSSSASTADMALYVVNVDECGAAVQRPHGFNGKIMHPGSHW